VNPPHPREAVPDRLSVPGELERAFPARLVWGERSAGTPAAPSPAVEAGSLGRAAEPAAGRAPRRAGFQLRFSLRIRRWGAARSSRGARGACCLAARCCAPRRGWSDGGVLVLRRSCLSRALFGSGDPGRPAEEGGGAEEADGRGRAHVGGAAGRAPSRHQGELFPPLPANPARSRARPRAVVQPGAAARRRRVAGPRSGHGVDFSGVQSSWGLHPPLTPQAQALRSARLSRDFYWFSGALGWPPADATSSSCD